MKWCGAVLLVAWAWLGLLSAQLTDFESFRTFIASDEIVFTSFSLFSDVEVVQLRVQAEDTSFTPKILIRKDGVPSPSLYDTAFDIPPLPEELVLIDVKPGPCILYIGIFGGDELHSNRYFAGAPVRAFVSLLSTRYYTNSTLASLPEGDPINVRFNQSGTLFSLPIEARTTQWSAAISVDTSQVNCSALPPSALRMRAVLSPKEEVHADYPIACPTAPVTFTIPFPRPGTWSISFAWSALAASNHASEGRQSWTAVPSSMLQRPQKAAVDASSAAFALQLSIRSSVASCPRHRVGTPAGPPFSPSASIAAPPCTTTPESMHVAKSLSSEGLLSYSSAQIPFPSQAIAFSLPLQSPLRSKIIMGGALVLTARMLGPWSSPSSPGQPSPAIPPPPAFTLTVRGCNLPASPWTPAYSFNSSQQGGQIFLAPSSEMALVEWILPRPVLAGVADDQCSELWLVLDPASSPSSSSSSEDWKFSLVAEFSPCPRGLCVHGTCVWQQDDVSSSSCQCRYPYAGEQCESLAVSFSSYVFQVLVLVFSNAFAIPCIRLCWENALFLVSSCLSLSALASALYHLCDTDAFCVMPFSALQTLDVLFSLSLIFLVVLLYAPLSPRTHASWSLMCVGLLVAPVSADPTSASNVIIAVVAAVGVVTTSHILLKLSLRNRLLHQFWGPDHTLAVVPTYSPLTASDLTPAQEVEMTSRTQGRPASLSEAEYADPASIEQRQDGASRSIIPPTTKTWNQLRYGLMGGCLGLAGFLCFSLQDKDNYWLVHSVWHACMMSAAYFVVKGRKGFFAFCSCQLPK